MSFKATMPSKKVKTPKPAKAGKGVKEPKMRFNAKYPVSMREKWRGHWYYVSTEDKKSAVNSVSGVLGIIGGNKIHNLMGWARKLAVTTLKDAIYAFWKDKEQRLTSTDLEEFAEIANKEPEKVKVEAGLKGDKVHDLIDKYIMGEPLEFTKESKIGFDNFMKWLKSENLTLLKGETKVLVLEEKDKEGNVTQIGFGGELDALAEDEEGNLVLLDWKTANYLHDETAVQVGGYAIAFEITYNEPIKRAIVVRFGKDEIGDVEPKEANLENAKAAFRSALALKNEFKPKLIWK